MPAELEDLYRRGKELVDKEHLKGIIREYRRQGFKTAIDDFGAGYAGLNLLAEFQPDIIKLDMALVRGIDADPVRSPEHALVSNVLLASWRAGRDLARPARGSPCEEGIAQARSGARRRGLTTKKARRGTEPAARTPTLRG